MFRWFLIILDSVLGLAFLVAGCMSFNLIAGVVCGGVAMLLFKQARKNFYKSS